MAIIFKNAPSHLGDSAQDYIKKNARIFCKEAGIPIDTTVHIGFNETKILHEHGSTTLKIGVADLQKNTSKIVAAAASVRNIFQSGYTTAPSVYQTKKTMLSNGTNLDEEQWIEQVAAEYFPNTVSLCNASKMYQLIDGTSNNSVYRAVFLGPNFRGAARIRDKTISLRFTTEDNMKPEGDVAMCLSRLGGTTKYVDRITCHAECAGTYQENPEEFRMVFGAFYGALRPFLTSPFPALVKLTEGTK